MFRIFRRDKAIAFRSEGAAQGYVLKHGRKYDNVSIRYSTTLDKWIVILTNN